MLSLSLKAVLARVLPDYRSTTVRRRSENGGDVAPSLRVPQRYEVRGLTYGYREQSLFRGVDVTLDGRTPTVLYGESGCGKTTLLRCMAGVVTPWEGESFSVGGDGTVGLVFQEDALLSHRDVVGNVLLSSLPDVNEEHLRCARQALSTWGLSEWEHHFPHQLSGGMRKRLAMAREWYRGSGVLLLDEPFVNLDREARVALWEVLFTRVQERGIPTLVVTHYPEEIDRHGVRFVSWEEISGIKDS